MRFRIFITILLLGVFAGCGKSPGTESVSEVSQKKKEETPDFDWRRDSLKEAQEITETEPLYCIAYKPYIYTEPELTGEPVYTAENFMTCGGNLYGIIDYVSKTSEEENTRQRYLFLLDGDTRESDFREFSVDIGDEHKKGKQESGLVTIDVPELDSVMADGMFFSFPVWETIKQGEEELYALKHYYMFYTDRQGKILDETDLAQSYRELGIAEAADVPVYPRKCITSPSGEYYILSEDSLALYGIDASGNTTKLLDCSQYKGSSAIGWGRAWDGTPVFYVWDREKRAALIYDIQSGKAGQIAAIPDLVPEDIYIDSKGKCYVREREQIFCWDMREGLLGKVYDLESEGINGRFLHMGADREGNLLFYNTGDSDRALYVLSETPPETVADVKIVDTRGFCLQSCAAIFSRRNPDCRISYEKVENDVREDYINRMTAELMTGKGPDIMVLTMSEMELLWEKGVLQDLTDMIPDEAKERQWKVMLDAGTIDGKMAGYALDGQGLTCVVSDDAWDKDTWTVMDVTRLLEERLEDKDFEGLFADYESVSAENAFSRVVLADIEHSPFINREAGQCFFDSEDFIHVLEVFGRLGTRSGVSAAPEKAVTDGGYLAQSVNVFNLTFFSLTMEYLGGKGHFVGCPTEGGNGNFFMINSVLAVNAASEHKEAVADFLEAVTGKEYQRQYYISIQQKDVLREYIEEDYMDTGKPAYHDQDGHVVLLGCKEDGSSYLKEFEDWMDNCVPYPAGGLELKKIIEEEAGSFFRGDQSAKTVAERIQNRVQLYLNEQK